MFQQYLIIREMFVAKEFQVFSSIETVLLVHESTLSICRLSRATILHLFYSSIRTIPDTQRP